MIIDSISAFVNVQTQEKRNNSVKGGADRGEQNGKKCVDDKRNRKRI